MAELFKKNPAPDAIDEWAEGALNTPSASPPISSSGKPVSASPPASPASKTVSASPPASPASKTVSANSSASPASKTVSANSSSSSLNNENSVTTSPTPTIPVAEISTFGKPTDPSRKFIDTATEKGILINLGREAIKNKHVTKIGEGGFGTVSKINAPMVFKQLQRPNATMYSENVLKELKKPDLAEYIVFSVHESHHGTTPDVVAMEELDGTVRDFRMELVELDDGNYSAIKDFYDQYLPWLDKCFTALNNHNLCFFDYKEMNVGVSKTSPSNSNSTKQTIKYSFRLLDTDGLKSIKDKLNLGVQRTLIRGENVFIFGDDPQRSAVFKGMHEYFKSFSRVKMDSYRNKTLNTFLENGVSEFLDSQIDLVVMMIRWDLLILPFKEDLVPPIDLRNHEIHGAHSIPELEKFSNDIKNKWIEKWNQRGFGPAVRCHVEIDPIRMWPKIFSFKLLTPQP